MAMAMVRREDGSLEVEHWSQAVIVTDEGDVRDDGVALTASDRFRFRYGPSR